MVHWWTDVCRAETKEADLTDEDNPEDVDIGSDSDSEQCSSDEEWEQSTEKKSIDCKLLIFLSDIITAYM